MPLSSRLAVPVVLGALVTASVAGAVPVFKGNVAGWSPPSRPPRSPVCRRNAPAPTPLQGPGSTIYVGNWAGLSKTSPTLQVTVAVYTDPGALKLARQNLKQGLPGPPKKVAGIGSAAYEAKGALSAGIHVAVGKYVAYITLATTGAPPKSATVLEPLAKAVAARL